MRSTCRLALLGALTLTFYNFVFHAAITHFRARYGLPMLFGAAPLAAYGLNYVYRRVLKINSINLESLKAG